MEGQYLDAKSQPYQFGTGMDTKRELAKDVAAFANAAGGCVLIGLTTQVSPIRAGEEITAVRPLSRMLFDPEQYRKILAEWLYPQPKDLTVSFVQFGSESDKGIGVVFVPPQDPGTKPFLITRTIGDKKSTEVVIGYVERRLDATDVRSVMELHHALRIGINLERELLGRIQSLESTVQRHFSAALQAQTEAQRANLLRVRIARTLDYPSLKDKAVLIAYATPMESSEVRSIFSDRPESIRRRLENPPSIRGIGWGLATGASARFVEGQHLRVESYRVVTDLYRDGCLIFAGSISQDFLAWSDKKDARLHPLALIEVITNFMKFFRLVLDDLRTTPERVMVGLELDRLHLGSKVHLPAGPIDPTWGTLLSFGPAPEAPSDTWKWKILMDAAAYNPERIAFEFARELYVWFGLAEEDVPYTTGEGDDRRIDLEQISRIG